MTTDLSLCLYQAYSGGLIAGYLWWVTEAVHDCLSLTVELVGREADRHERKQASPTAMKGLEDVRILLAEDQFFEAGTHIFLFQLHIPVGTPPSTNSQFQKVDYEVVATITAPDSPPSSTTKAVAILGPASMPYGNHASWAFFIRSGEQVQAMEAAWLRRNHDRRQEAFNRLQAERHDRMEAVQTVVVEKIFENERRLPLGAGWSKRFLLPTERPHYTDEACVPRRKEEVNLPDNDWAWEDDWHIELTGEDLDGWWYAFNWPKSPAFGSKEWQPREHRDSYVRRRLWLRTRVNRAAVPERERVRAAYDARLAAASTAMASEEAADVEASAERGRENDRRAESAKRQMSDFISLMTPIVQGRVCPSRLFESQAFAPPPYCP
jgi:hypothetical protein